MNNLESRVHALNEQSKYSEVKRTLSYMPVYSTRSILDKYKKQLVETRTLIYHQQNLRMLSDKEQTDPVAKKSFVIKKVARELWTNFCVRGQETPMLQHLRSNLRKEYGEDLQFHYLPGSIELVIMKQGEEKMEVVSKVEQITIVNRAWQISQDVVGSYAT